MPSLDQTCLSIRNVYKFPGPRFLNSEKAQNPQIPLLAPDSLEKDTQQGSEGGGVLSKLRLHSAGSISMKVHQKIQSTKWL